MNCAQARRLFGAYWDDDTSQAERECVESHFVACPACRREYEEFSRVLELTGSLPRVEASPGLLERTLARARRAALAPDRLPRAGVQWVPVTAAAALLLIAATLVSPWIGLRPGQRIAGRVPQSSVGRTPEIAEPVLVNPRLTVAPAPSAVAARPTSPSVHTGPLASGPDSLFDHGEDVEFILDPVTLRRGRPSMNLPRTAGEGERAVITF